MSASAREKDDLGSQATYVANGNEDVSAASSTLNLDDNYHIYKQSNEVEIDPAEVKRVLRKIDMRVIPVLFITYLLQYLDKNSINFASVYGLKKGTHLVGQDYSWLGKYDVLWIQLYTKTTP